ncbi:MAG TPA: ADP-ribosylglycohydrolase family protein [Pseudothermotoga sp.]|nr:ADP-ribosylglycohydrolase family protein [Pseudothermotoga sp.]HOK83158.1 ADP-ribosylglycohydrolase family protein [Pseudothermotoga sp.]HPP69671.1 ADP-ribosylglycohydrolase family protein [Pseudothermotoga sp.]
MEMVSRFVAALEAFATGDAMGMPTEFVTREVIREKYGLIDELIDPSEISLIHRNLVRGQVTDDTEQVLELIETYYRTKRIDSEVTLTALRTWCTRTDAAAKGYVGPSTLKVLLGESNTCNGTTCGAAMRVLAVALSVKQGDIQNLKKAIWESCLCTHNSDIAIEAAMAIGYGYHYAALDNSYETIIDQIIKGALEGRNMGSNSYVGAHTGHRIMWAVDAIRRMSSPEEVLDFVYEVIGTTMESNEVVPAAVSIFSYAKENVWLAIRMGASVGGDTDTIAAIAGALSALYAKGHDIPLHVVKEVLETNQLDLYRYAKMLAAMFSGDSDACGNLFW